MSVEESAEQSTESAEAVEVQQLPEAVRARIVALTAQVLPKVTPLPPALKRVAEFAPARRARLGGSQIASALGLDDFRGHVAVQAAVVIPELAIAVHDGLVPSTADPTDVAALAWLLRPDGWQELVTAAVEQVESRLLAEGTERGSEEVRRLRAKLADVEQTARDQRSRLKEQLDAVKAENTSLRRKLGDARAAERAATEESRPGQGRGGSSGERGPGECGLVREELRRLRARVAELEALATAVRRDARVERDDASLRARLLLDTLLESAQGLRRELSLPTVSGAPGDRLEAELSAGEPGARTTSAAGAMGPSSPALLENYLAMPRARLIIDGYNVSMAAWPESPLEAQRIRLLGGIAPLVARSGAETTIVFDAATSESRPPVNPPRGVKVIFSPVGVIADDVIRDLVDAEPQGRMVVVVTSDQEIVNDVRRAGARTVAADALIGVLARQ